MNIHDRCLDDLVVVDETIGGYEAIFTDEHLLDLPHRHYTTGEEALQRVDASLATLWMVNVRLPDMSGVCLLNLLRRRRRRCPVFLIGDVYSAEDELSARAAGASAYLCKPVNAVWLRLCRQAVARAALRRGAPHSLP